MKKRILAFSLILTMLMSMCTFIGAFAEETATEPTLLFELGIGDTVSALSNKVSGNSTTVSVAGANAADATISSYSDKNGNPVKYLDLSADATSERLWLQATDSEWANKSVTMEMWILKNWNSNGAYQFLGFGPYDTTAGAFVKDKNFIAMNGYSSSNYTYLDINNTTLKAGAITCVSRQQMTQTDTPVHLTVTRNLTTNAETGKTTITTNWWVNGAAKTNNGSKASGVEQDTYDESIAGLQLGSIGHGWSTFKIAGLKVYEGALDTATIKGHYDAELSAYEMAPIPKVSSAGYADGSVFESHEALPTYTFNTEIDEATLADGFALTDSEGNEYDINNITLSSNKKTATVDICGLPAGDYTLSTTTNIKSTLGVSLETVSSYTYTINPLFDMYENFSDADLWEDVTGSNKVNTFSANINSRASYMESIANLEELQSYITSDGALYLEHKIDDDNSTLEAGINIYNGSQKEAFKAGKVIYDFDIKSGSAANRRKQTFRLVLRGSKSNYATVWFGDNEIYRVESNAEYKKYASYSSSYNHVTMEVYAPDAASDWNVHVYVNGEEAVLTSGGVSVGEGVGVTLSRSTYGDINGIRFIESLGGDDDVNRNINIKNLSIKYFGMDSDVTPYRMHFRTEAGAEVAGIGDYTSLVLDYLATGDMAGDEKVYIACYKKEENNPSRLLNVCEPAALSRDGNLVFTIPADTTDVAAYFWDSDLTPLCVPVSLKDEPES